MNHFDYTTTKEKFKHLRYSDLRLIESDYNIHMALPVKNRPPRMVFLKKLAQTIGTSLSNLYRILDLGMVDNLRSNLTVKRVFSADAIPLARTPEFSNSSKIHKAKPFLDLVVSEYSRTKGLHSFDEIIHDLKIHHPEKIEGMTLVCTKTAYNYVNSGFLEVKRIDLPLAVKRKAKKEKREAKRHKGTSIDERPIEANLRTEFGHWEGDLVLGGLTKEHGALLTLVERKTRFTLSARLENRSASAVLEAINRLDGRFGDSFPFLFKSITFDNGNEFSCHEAIEKRPGSDFLRTKVYFAHPYCSWERGSNENCNRLFRYFIKKGENILHYSARTIQFVTDIINTKVRRMFGYQSADTLFMKEMAMIGF